MRSPALVPVLHKLSAPVLRDANPAAIAAGVTTFIWYAVGMVPVQIAAVGQFGLDSAQEEIDRLRSAWTPAATTDCFSPDLAALLGAEAAANLDRFDRVQLEDVLAVCLKSFSLADAGRTLFAKSRAQKKTTNDSDRLRKYLQSWGISWESIHRQANL